MRSYYRLVLWSIFWAALWPFMLIFKKEDEENCVTWAMKKWEENPKGYVVIRWSRSNKYPWLSWPHFLFMETEGEEFKHLLPENANDIDKHLVPAMWFKGEEATGDSEKQGYEN